MPTKKHASTPGLVHSGRPPNPPPDPRNVTWPNRTQATAAVRKHFGKTVTRLMGERSLKGTQLAGIIFGVRSDGKAINHASPAQWKTGRIPKRDYALWLAEVFGVPLSELLPPTYPAGEGARPGGVPVASSMATAAEVSTRVGKRGNGHVIPEPLQLPKNAPPPNVEAKTFKGDPRFMTVTLTGTFPADAAMSLIALAARER